MRPMDSLLSMIELVEIAGIDKDNEKYIEVVPEAVTAGWRKLLGLHPPARTYRVRNVKHSRGLAERRNLSLAIKDPKSALTLQLELGYRVACEDGHEKQIAYKLSQGSSPQDTLDLMIEAWIREFESQTPEFLRKAGDYIDAMAALVAKNASELGLRLTVFLEKQPRTRRTMQFSLPVSFLNETESESVSIRIGVELGKDPDASHRARIEDTPETIEQDIKMLIQEICGSRILRDTAERQPNRVEELLQKHLNSWLWPFGLESLVEAFFCPSRSKPDVTHTVRVDGIINLGHFQWQVRSTMEIESPEIFMQQRRERQIQELHIWLGEQYPEFCWESIRRSSGDQDQFENIFREEVSESAKTVGYKLKRFLLRRVLSEVEQDAQKQHLEDYIKQDQFLSQRIDNIHKKLLNAYDADDDEDDPERIKKYEAQLGDLKKEKAELVDEIAKTRADTKGLLPPVTIAAIGGERRHWTAIADGTAEKKSKDVENGEKMTAAPALPESSN